MELRERLIKLLEDEFEGTLSMSHVADCILALPEIAEALKGREWENKCPFCDGRLVLHSIRGNALNDETTTTCVCIQCGSTQKVSDGIVTYHPSGHPKSLRHSISTGTKE